MTKELEELHDRLSREIETMRRTGRSDIFHILWDYETEDASDEVLDMCQAAREAHYVAFIEWKKAHPAEWAAVLKKAQSAREAHYAAFTEWKKAHPAEWAAVLKKAQAAREARYAAFIEWKKAHPAEWAAVLKKADEATAARIAADDILHL